MWVTLTPGGREWRAEEEWGEVTVCTAFLGNGEPGVAIYVSPL